MKPTLETLESRCLMDAAPLNPLPSAGSTAGSMRPDGLIQDSYALAKDEAGAIVLVHATADPYGQWLSNERRTLPFTMAVDAATVYAEPLKVVVSWQIGNIVRVATSTNHGVTWVSIPPANLDIFDGQSVAAGLLSNVAPVAFEFNEAGSFSQIVSCGPTVGYTEGGVLTVTVSYQDAGMMRTATLFRTGIGWTAEVHEMDEVFANADFLLPMSTLWEAL